jgi:predicted TIM-barrel fold metal-dependent hydrolase
VTPGAPGSGDGGADPRQDWAHGTPHDPGGGGPDRAQTALQPFLDELATLRGDGELWDVHTHLGLDEDGRSMELPALLALLDQADVARACVFPLHDPERRPAYRVPNDRVLGWAAESDGRLTPFCRLDPGEGPVAEGERALDAGARGIKLHPRAQAFAFDTDGMEAIFALAEERRVPVLIHMGRGMPPVADGLVRLAHAHPGVRLVLAHAGIADQNVLARGLRDHPGVFYDTSCFLATDVLELFARVPVERICFGSDPPYGRPITGLYLALRSALAAGASSEQVALVGGGSAAALVAGGELPEPTAPVLGEHREVNGLLARIESYTAVAMGGAFAGNTTLAAEMLDLAVASCRDPEPGDLEPTLARLGPSLDAAKQLVADPETVFFGIGLSHLCQSLAATGGVLPTS